MGHFWSSIDLAEVRSHLGRMNQKTGSLPAWSTLVGMLLWHSRPCLQLAFCHWCGRTALGLKDSKSMSSTVTHPYSSPRGSSLLTWVPAHHTLRPLLLSHPSPSSPISLISSQAQISAFHSLMKPRPAPWPCSCSDGTVWPGRPAPGWPPRAVPLSPGSARQHSPQHCTVSALPLGQWDRPTAASSGLTC